MQKGPPLCVTPPRKAPKFRTEDEEREFWATHDSTPYVDWPSARPVPLPKLKRAAR